MPSARRSGARLPRIGLLWTQFSAYHVDRCKALGKGLAGQAEVLAVEVATASNQYAWEPSGAVGEARKITLFPGRVYETIGIWARFRAMFRALRVCDSVFIGISYADPAVILLSLCLPLFGVRVIMCSDSKFDDYPRSILKEVGKALVLLPYRGALVSGDRAEQFYRFLGFRRRPVLQGYDTVDIERVRAQGGAQTGEGTLYENRPFVFVGRFVVQKDIPFLLEGYQRYRCLDQSPRPLLLVGDGPLSEEVQDWVRQKGLEGQVKLCGFRPADDVSAILANGLALVLTSQSERWGLVINEAAASGLPIVTSGICGARDALVRNLVNGFVVEQGNVDGLARAMLALATNEAEWRRMGGESARLAERGHTDVLVAAVTRLALPR